MSTKTKGARSPRTGSVCLPGFRLAYDGAVGRLRLFGLIDILWVGRRFSVGLA